MRLRKKWYARPEIEESSLVILNPRQKKGNWKDVFENDNPIHLELGCGSGKFLKDISLKNLNINFVGIDNKDEVLINALRNLKEYNILNARIVPFQISFIHEIFDKGEIDRIYINFCNPWPKRRHNKRRLTNKNFLEKYKVFLKSGSEIWFKTDDKELFQDSLDYFIESGFKIKYETYDLHNEGFDENILTEYEEKFLNLGMKIMFLIAKID
ncbi:MAG: tRNA (guanosine(46)-N7)-methyltransferase TrmB [Oscillospiraceae bacterium]|nr:tRNA (guanosine(46)-N7)-methyltransferase TrmB [Oscillospiraceae bacterium]